MPLYGYPRGGLPPGSQQALHRLLKTSDELVRKASAIFCFHANEVPKGPCKCPADCPCHETMCQVVDAVYPEPKTAYDHLDDE